MIERVLAVVSRDGQEAGGGEPLVQSVGKGVADPAEIRLTGAVLEGKNEDDASGRRCRIGWLLRNQRRGGKKKHRKEQERTTKDGAK